MTDQEQTTPLVHEMEELSASQKKHNDTHNSSINKQDVAIDNFISNISNTDSKIRKELRGSRYSYFAGEHGLTVR